MRPVPIRVMHIVEALGVGGGVEHGLANLIERMDPRAVEHVVCSVFRLGPRLERYPADRVRVMCLNQKSRTHLVPLVKAIRETRPAVVHSRNWGALEAVPAARCARSCSVIHSEHGFERDPSRDPRRRKWLRRVAFELADQVFCVSTRLRSTLAEQTGFAATKIGVIHNGVDLERFRPDPSARERVRRSLGIDDGEFCIGCVGRLNHVKDYATMLRAARVFGASRDRWRLVVAGAGSEQDALHATVQGDDTLRRRVHFLGDVRNIPELLNALDVYVLPSLWEGISNSLLEAMAVGLPVVASNVGGNPEVINDGESGLLFPVGDANQLARQLQVLAERHDVGRQLAANAAARARTDFSLPAMVARYEEMYAAAARQ